MSEKEKKLFRQGFDSSQECRNYEIQSVPFYQQDQRIT